MVSSPTSLLKLLQVVQQPMHCLGLQEHLLQYQQWALPPHLPAQRQRPRPVPRIQLWLPRPPLHQQHLLVTYLSQTRQRHQQHQEFPLRLQPHQQTQRLLQLRLPLKRRHQVPPHRRLHLEQHQREPRLLEQHQRVLRLQVLRHPVRRRPQHLLLEGPQLRLHPQEELPHPQQASRCKVGASLKLLHPTRQAQSLTWRIQTTKSLWGIRHLQQPKHPLRVRRQPLFLLNRSRSGPNTKQSSTRTQHYSTLIR